MPPVKFDFFRPLPDRLRLLPTQRPLPIQLEIIPLSISFRLCYTTRKLIHIANRHEKTCKWPLKVGDHKNLLNQIKYWYRKSRSQPWLLLLYYFKCTHDGFYKYLTHYAT
jgi:hypothetical protein